ncbi:hypothetical protein ACXZ66_06835 [Corynebacterium sp. S7]
MQDPTMHDPKKLRHIAVHEDHTHFECYCGHVIPKGTHPSGRKTWKEGKATEDREWCETCLYLSNLNREMKEYTIEQWALDVKNSKDNQNV